MSGKQNDKLRQKGQEEFEELINDRLFFFQSLCPADLFYRSLQYNLL